MKRIIVGSDGSPGSSNALRWAGSLASAHHAEVVVMTAFTPTDSEIRPSRYEQLLAECQRDLDRWSSVARCENVAIRTVVAPGDPRPAILELADREDADLIVVGREGRSAGPGLLHIGSLAEWLAHHADRPVAIVGGAVSETTRSALVCVDGSQGSRTAMSWVADLANHANIRVVAAAVEDGLGDWTRSTGSEGWAEPAEQQIREAWVDALPKRDVDISVLALQGVNVSDALLLAARHERTDVIVIGMRGLGGFSGLRIGGVALKVLHRADRPVILVPVA